MDTVLDRLDRLNIRSLAHLVELDWTPVNFGARPYLDAMHTLDSIDQHYGADSAKTIVLYFLSNAKTWRGETAKAVKAELKRRVR